MVTITIPKEFARKGDLVVIPRKKYEDFLNLEKIMERRLIEESDTDSAIKIYKKKNDKGN